MTGRFLNGVRTSHHTGSWVSADMGNFPKVLKRSYMWCCSCCWECSDRGERFCDGRYVSLVVELVVMEVVGSLGEKNF